MKSDERKGMSRVIRIVVVIVAAGLAIGVGAPSSPAVEVRAQLTDGAGDGVFDKDPIAGEHPVAPEGMQEVSIVLQGGLTPRDTLSMLAEADLVVKQLHHQSDSGTGGYVLAPGESLEEAMQQYQQDHVRFERERISQLRILVGEASDPSLKAALRTSLRRAERAALGSRFTITSVDAAGTTDAIRHLDRAALGRAAITLTGGSSAPAKNPLVSNPTLQSVPNPISGTIACSTTSSDGKEYVPSWGKALTAKDQYSRYIYQFVYWDNVDRLRWFANTPDSTFEPDAFFYNYDRTAYGSAPVGYWASDLPAAYVDTQFGDGPNEKAVTIGSASARNIIARYVYYTVTRMTDGGGTSSWTKLSSQRGRRWPDWCFGTNCSYGCDNTSNFITVPFRNFTSPGCVTYWWLWNISTTASCN